MQDTIADIRERVARVETQMQERASQIDLRLDRIERKLDDIPTRVNGNHRAALTGWGAAGAGITTALGAIGKVAGWW
mgnify:FL=1